MRKHNIHKMFFSCNGIHLERGISETNSRQASFKERVIECSENVYCLADSTKIGLKSSFFFAEISDLTTVVTNEDSDPGFIAALTNRKIEVLKA
jgi:DeoR/GlpR family transcriptional regulator of sugar metabolism